MSGVGDWHGEGVSGAGDWHGEGVSGAGEGVLGSVSISRAGDTQPPQTPVLSLLRCQFYMLSNVTILYVPPSSYLGSPVTRVMGMLSSLSLSSSVLPSS